MQSLTDIQTAMGLLKHRYYTLNKMLIKLYEQWPMQSTRVRAAIITIILSACATLATPLIIAIANNRDDLDLLLDGVSTLVFAAYNCVKFFFAVFTSQKMLTVLNHIRMDCKIWAQDRDVDVLKEYVQKGRKMTFVYAGKFNDDKQRFEYLYIWIWMDLSILHIVGSYGTFMIFVLAPIVPKIGDILLRNGTEPGQFPIPVDYYYIDMQRYYFYIILHCFLCASLGFIFPMTYSCMYIVIVQHGCGLFSALGRKLQRIGKIKRSVEATEITDAVKKQEVDLENLAWCIDRHHDAIEYTKLIEATYSWFFLVILGINVFAISISGLQIAKRTIDRQQTIRFTIVNLMCMIHLYFDNYMAQTLMDHSNRIRYELLNGKWYNFPLTTQKLLLLMMTRCNVPCKLTAGKMTVLSTETFVMFLKTSISYFTLLRSI